MADYNLDSKAASSNKNPVDAYANIYINVGNNGSTRNMQLGKFGIALDKTRKLDALIIKLAQEEPDALQNLILSVKVAVLDENNSTDDLELSFKS